jgi:hypothetical protein
MYVFVALSSGRRTIHGILGSFHAIPCIGAGNRRFVNAGQRPVFAQAP